MFRAAMAQDLADDAPWIADAACLQPIEEPARPGPRCRDARSALVWAILAVVCLGFVFGPLALSTGRRARLAIVMQPELGGARMARVAVVLGTLGMALHLTILMAVLPWLLFVLPLVGSLGG